MEIIEAKKRSKTQHIQILVRTMLGPKSLRANSIVVYGANHDVVYNAIKQKLEEIKRDKS